MPRQQRDIGQPTPRHEAFLAGTTEPTPYVVVDLDEVTERYRSLAPPMADEFHAIKASTAPEILALLVRLGAGFVLARVARAGLGTGISFHVPSQQRDPEVWDVALADTAELFERLRAEGVEPDVVTIGGRTTARPRGVAIADLLDMAVIDGATFTLDGGPMKSVLREVVAGQRDVPLAALQRRVPQRSSDSMEIESLWRFNKKFRPRWHPRYVVTDSFEHLAAQGLAIADAESIWELPLVGRLPRPDQQVAASG